MQAAAVGAPGLRDQQRQRALPPRQPHGRGNCRHVVRRVHPSQRPGRSNLPHCWHSRQLASLPNIAGSTGDEATQSGLTCFQKEGACRASVS